MTFYLKPPKGHIVLHNLEKCVEQRLRFYKNQKRFLENDDCCDCLVEDSAFDRTGHFMLRLQACENPSFKYRFVRMEVKLLETRLNCYEASDLKMFFKRLQKHSTENLEQYDLPERLQNIYLVFVQVALEMMQKKYLNHIFSNIHVKAKYCEEFITEVPFYLCPSLLQERVINVHKGFLQITCKDWKSCLLSLYENYLSVILTHMKLNSKVPLLIEDERLKEILNRHTHSSNNYGQISAKFNVFNIEPQAKLFPLCMLNLYQILKESNRLPHNERFDFGVYLKDIGVPVEHALKFWEIFYSKQHSTCSKCTHDWKNNEKRYIYGVRHLYGLEGSRKQYTMKSCNTIQNTTLGARECGGCPFQHFDDENLRKLLTGALPNHKKQVEVLIKTRQKSPQQSCKVYYNIMYRINTSGKQMNNNVSFQNPVQYYISLKKCTD